MKDHWMAYMVISFMTCTSMHKIHIFAKKPATSDLADSLSERKIGICEDISFRTPVKRTHMHTKMPISSRDPFVEYGCKLLHSGMLICPLIGTGIKKEEHDENDGEKQKDHYLPSKRKAMLSRAVIIGIAGFTVCTAD